jgi:5-methylcytosine-specific restriction endonuclease McrA
MSTAIAPQQLPDDDLLRRLTELLAQTRRTEAEILAHIAEVDARRLYAREACPSMFVYCTERLHLSEAEAYMRITAARAAREHPALLSMVADGRLHLSAIARLAPILTADNRDAVLARATCRSKREVLELVAELSPRTDAPTSIRKLPECGRTAGRVEREGLGGSRVATGSTTADSDRGNELCPDRVRPAGPPAHSSVEPIAPGRYKVQFTATADLREKLERLQSLMRGTAAAGDLAAVIEAAVTEKLQRLEARRGARVAKPRTTLRETDTRPRARHVPAAVRRAVRERDQGQCRFVDRDGRRCSERRHLEFHHRHPFGMGGDHAVDNVQLMCRTHNRYVGEADYGKSHYRPARGERETTASP